MSIINFNINDFINPNTITKSTNKKLNKQLKQKQKKQTAIDKFDEKVNEIGNKLIKLEENPSPKFVIEKKRKIKNKIYNLVYVAPINDSYEFQKEAARYSYNHDIKIYSFLHDGIIIYMLYVHKK